MPRKRIDHHQKNTLTKQFKEANRRDIDLVMNGGLDKEIELLRAYILQVARLADLEDQDNPLEKAVKVMSALSLAILRLGSLLRIQQLLGSVEGDLGIAISQALAEVLKEMEIN